MTGRNDSARVTLKVSAADAGMKLLRFLERRLNAPRPALYRWLRTGQIRVNGGRARAETLLAANDEIRLPPQAGGAMIAQAGAGAFPNAPVIPDSEQPLPSAAEFGPGLKLMQATEYYLVLDKAAGLPVQPGSGHTDSVSSRLKKQAAQGLSSDAATGVFIPAPAHRLDKQSSGIILAGRNHLGQRYLHSLFAGEGEEAASGKAGPEPASGKSVLDRQYFVWVSGIWELEPRTVLTDMVFQAQGPDGLERMYAEGRPGAPPKGARKAVRASSEYTVLKTLEHTPCGPATLLRVRLFTGRKHQIRVQCAARGRPVIGDRRYDGPRFTQMLLHAGKISIPGAESFLGAHIPAAEYFSPPRWPEPFGLEHFHIEKLSDQ